MATAILNSATEQNYRLQQPSHASHTVTSATPTPRDSLRHPSSTSERVTLNQAVTSYSPEENTKPVETAKQRHTEQLKEQQQHNEELEAARKAREKQEAQVEAARKAREEKLEAEREQRREQLELLDKLQRKIDLGLYDATKADLIAKEYQTISKSFTIGSILSPDIDLDHVDFYA